MATPAKSKKSVRKSPVPANETDRQKFERLVPQFITKDEGIAATAFGTNVEQAHADLQDAVSNIETDAFSKDGSLNKKWAKDMGVTKVEDIFSGLDDELQQDAMLASLFGDGGDEASDDDDGDPEDGSW